MVKRFRYALALFSILAFFCEYYEKALAQSPQKLKTKTYSVCGKKVLLEIADTPQSKNVGLMYRSSLAAGAGMLFVFEKESVQNFWMKNVPFDIDIGFFSKNKTLVFFMTMKGTSPLQREETLPQYSSEKSAQWAVEVPVGFFVKKDLKHCRLEP